MSRQALSLIYYGTPVLAVPPLQRLVADGRPPRLVVTRPDRPKGRGLKTSPSPVKEAALALGLPVATPARAGAPEEIDRIKALAPDLIVLAAYGQILPAALLDIPRIGALNVHYSLLPRWRGAAPIQAALLAGDAETGVTTMWMTAGLDEGPVFLARATPIEPGEDAGALGARLAALGAECLAESLDRIEGGEIARAEQDHARATLAPKLRAEDARLAPSDAPEAIARRVRAFAPEPGAWLDLGAGGRLLVLAAAPGSSVPSGAATGTVLAVDRARGLEIALPRGSLWLSRVKPAGRQAMAAADWANGLRLKPGARVPIEDRARAGSP